MEIVSGTKKRGQTDIYGREKLKTGNKRLEAVKMNSQDRYRALERHG